MGKLKSFLFLPIVALLWAVCTISVAQEAAQKSSSSSRSSRASRSSSATNNATGGRLSRGETTDSRERRREERQKTRDNNSRRTSRSNTTGDAKKEPPKDAKTVEASKKKETTKGKSSAGGARPPLDIAFEMQADPETNIMYIESAGTKPSLNMTAFENKTFVTHISLYNAKSSEFDQFDVSLRYDPQLLQPVGVDDSAVSSTLKKPMAVRVDKSRGILSMSGDFATSRTDSFVTLAKVQWKALAPAAATPIRFLNTEAHPSGVFNRFGENILHGAGIEATEISPQTGLLDGTVTIEPPDGEVDLTEESSNPFSTIALATNISMGTAEGGMQLVLRPRNPAPAVGEEFLVDVVYLNPKRADLDTVRLEIRFDPTVLEVVDYDTDNWITRGINIFDGAYHEDLPFDFHRRNVAYNTTGLIQYEMGFSDRTPVPAQGIIATIKFRALMPAAQTVVGFVTDFGEQSAATPSRQTTLSFLGFNLIGTPGHRASAIQNAAITIR